MNIEEIKADLESINRIRAERDEAFYKIRPEDFTGCLPYDKFLKAQGAVNDKCWTAIDAVTSKYLFIFESDGVDIAPAYYPTGHRIDDFLKFFLVLYSQAASGWKPASDPPKGNQDRWTKDVVAFTNYGKAHLLAYYNGKDGGCWQRPSEFADGTKVEWWIEQPAALSAI